MRSWLFGIATNMMRRHCREAAQQSRLAQRLSGRTTVVDAGDERVVERLDAQSRVGTLATAINGLADGDRDVLLLTSLAGLDCAEVAAALGIPEGTVRSRLHRVRRVLRQAPIETTEG
jgi:RNA polymerase sigma-70 factor (ECF subfamily)